VATAIGFPEPRGVGALQVLDASSSDEVTSRMLLSVGPPPADTPPLTALQVAGGQSLLLPTGFGEKENGGKVNVRVHVCLCVHTHRCQAYICVYRDYMCAHS
jgi:hypothetical protein